MRNKFLFVLFVSLIVAFATVSAQVAIYSPTNATVSSNTNATGTFTLGNTNLTTNITGVTCTITSSLGTSSTTCPTILTNNTNTSITYYIFVPSSTAAGNYAAAINASGTLSGASVSDTKGVTITVSSTPSLTLEWITMPSDVYSGDNATGTVNITNLGNMVLNVSLVASLSNSTSNSTFTLNPSSSTTRNFNLSTSRLNIGSNTFTVSATGTNSSSSTSTSLSRTISINYLYCAANSTTSPIYIDDIVNDDDILDNDFQPLEKFNVKVKIRNGGTESKHVVVKTVLVKSSEIDGTEEDMTQKISDDSTKTFNLNMSIPSDLSRGEYYLFVKAYDDDHSSNCEQRSIKFYVDKEDHQVIPSSIELTYPVECESIFEVKGTLVNLGDEDEERVKLVYYDDLGLGDNLILENLDSGDENDFSFSFNIPKNATEKNYRMTLKTYFDYDEDDDNYGETESYFYTYNVSGNCFKEIRNASVSTLTQTAFVSEDSDVSIAITNTGNTQETYTINASSNDFLIKSISPSSLTLAAGSTSYVTVKVLPKENITSGIHNLAVGIAYSGKSETKQISLNVQKTSLIPSKWYDSVKNAFKGNNTAVIIIDTALAVIIVALIVKLLSVKAASRAAPAVSEVYRNNIKKNFR